VVSFAHLYKSNHGVLKLSKLVHRFDIKYFYALGHWDYYGRAGFVFD
jgi:hypothetical protein